MSRYSGGGIDERYRDLAVAIIEQAISDYKNSRWSVSSSIRNDCILFFLSDWFKELSGGIDGKILLDRLRREYG